MTEEQHKWLFLTVRDLDAVIPKPTEAVQITSDDGETYMLTATQEGYLRLGVEMLKAATLTPCERDEDGSLHLEADLSWLMAPENEVYVETFRMVDAIPPLPELESSAGPTTNSWKERLTSLCLTGFVCFLLLALIVGIGTIVFFLLNLLR